MRSFTLPALLGFAILGANAERRHHRHARLHDRGLATVVDVVTEFVTETVFLDESTAPPTTTSTSTTSTTTPAAIFIEVPTSSSSSSTTTAAASSPVIPIAPQVQGIAVAPSPSSPPPASTPPAPTQPAPAPQDPVVPGERTFTIINSHTAPISTAHDDTAGTPTSAGQLISPGTIAPGAVATFAVQAGWIGNIAINDANFPITTDSTLIEANFVEWFGTPRADFDVSFVNGFTLPATCSCAGQVTTGCNLDLNAIMSCPDGIVNNSCVNPLRALEAATSASSFFSPCQGAAWTFVNDGNADSNCIEGSIVCCVGAACPPNPKQGSA